MTDIKQKVIDELNAEFGSDLKNLEKISKFHKELQAEKNAIEESVRHSRSTLIDIFHHIIILFIK